MFKRKLIALEHINPGSVNIHDDQSLRDLVLWLEDQKIRHYKIEERKFLKVTGKDDWNKSFKKYLSDLDCPLKDDVPSIVDWLLGLAVQLDYGDNYEKFQGETADNIKKRNAAPTIVSSNPLEKLDFQSQDFIDGINEVTGLLKIRQHPEHLTSLKALSLMISCRLSRDALADPGKVVPKGKAYPIEEMDLGFETGDNTLNQAAKKLRLLYVHDLRDLQTKVNECIVACQEVTANPKTDTKLGKVGY